MTKTETQIRALKIEATRQRDFALVRLCDAALTGDDFASRVCLAAINEALPSALDVEIMLRTMSRGATWRAVREHGATLSHGDWNTLGDDQRDWARASLGRIAEYEDRIEIEPVPSRREMLAELTRMSEENGKYFG